MRHSVIFTKNEMMKIVHRLFFLFILLLTLLVQSPSGTTFEGTQSCLHGPAEQWDEAIPLGNGMIGALVWQKGANLRISIDRADLWDLRPTKEIEKYTYQWAYLHKLSGDWDTVWKVADEPYDRDAAPTKIPGQLLNSISANLGNLFPLSWILPLPFAPLSGRGYFFLNLYRCNTEYRPLFLERDQHPSYPYSPCLLI